MTAAIAAGWMLLAAPLASAGVLSAADHAKAVAAFAEAETGQWDKALKLAEQAKDPLLAQVIYWLDLVRPGSDATPQEISRFIAEYPEWPSQSLLRRRVEEQLNDKTSDAFVLEWFKNRKPETAAGMLRRAEALMATGAVDEGHKALRAAWVSGNFSDDLERRFYQKHRKLLTPTDHRQRLERLLWEDRQGPARRILWHVEPEVRALAEARMQLSRREGNVDKAIAKVPAQLRNDSGLLYDRVRWRRRKGQDDAARDILAELPAKFSFPEKWWDEREALARRAVMRGEGSVAYKLVKNHGMTPGSGSDFADAEWFAGWLAFRFLDDAGAATRHFGAMYGAVSFPVSQARAAYWSGRVAAAIKDEASAKRWYGLAAQHPTTFYGQLAAEKLNPGQALVLPPDPIPTPAEISAFAKHPLARAVHLLVEVEAKAYMPAFLHALAAADDTAVWRSLTADLAKTQDRPELAIAIAKRAHQEKKHVIPAGYPTVPLPRYVALNGAPSVEAPLVLAVVRQESAFAVEARSRAGALGLMQLMPATAKAVAKGLKVDVGPGGLTADPTLNVTLGQAYLGSLLDTFNGSYVLALASYNAGPGRAQAWVRANGDPRSTNVDVIDWIESIPFNETRNYVQRVLENVQVYRARLNGSKISETLAQDLRR
ncbi:MAG: lytic transglycosylase domain-containing protein [Rhodospirillales bacterium]|nr:lytic transglycosylase domain-containing protein [Rhodospirillales bacterium]